MPGDAIAQCWALLSGVCFTKLQSLWVAARGSIYGMVELAGFVIGMFVV